MILEYGSFIRELTFDGFEWQSSAGSRLKSPELLKIESGSLGRLVLDSLDSTHISLPAAVADFNSIGLVTGQGVLATGWEFPDFVMADEVPYISASNGLTSIKYAGVVKRYVG